MGVEGTAAWNVFDICAVTVNTSRSSSTCRVLGCAVYIRRPSRVIFVIVYGVAYTPFAATVA